MPCIPSIRAGALLLVLAACGGGDSVVSPPGPGPIDMNGAWAVADIERRDSMAALPTPSPIGTPLFPLAQGQLILITDAVARTEFGSPLFSNWQGVAPERYTNFADGRNFVLDVATAWLTSCESSLSVRATFSPVDEDTMFGMVDVRYETDCTPSFLDNNPNGAFAVRLTRVGVPAIAGEPASDR